MKIDIYKTNGRNTYIAVRSGTEVPKEVPLQGFVRSMEIAKGKPLTGMDQDKVMDEIESKGWSIFGAVVEVKIVR